MLKPNAALSRDLRLALTALLRAQTRRGLKSWHEVSLLKAIKHVQGLLNELEG